MDNRPTKEHLSSGTVFNSGTNSATDCTGLFAVPPQNPDEVENYKDIYNFGIPDISCENYK